MQRLSRQDAETLLRHCVEEGIVEFGYHARKALAEESFGTEAVWFVLEHGAILFEPEHDVRTGDWKYRIEGYEPAGQ